MDLENINIEKIETIKIVNSVWVAKTTFFIPNKTEIEMKGNSESNCYEKLLKLLEFDKKPTEIKVQPNGNKIYYFKKPSNHDENV